METTLVILKPSAVLHGYVGQIVQRFQQKGLVIRGMKMMQLGEPILREHYAHLTDRPFFPDLLKSMMASPVIVMGKRKREVCIILHAGSIDKVSGKVCIEGIIEK